MLDCPYLFFFFSHRPLRIAALAAATMRRSSIPSTSLIHSRRWLLPSRRDYEEELADLVRPTADSAAEAMAGRAVGVRSSARGLRLDRLRA